MNNTDKFIYEVIDAYLKDNSVQGMSVDNLLVMTASCRYHDNRIFVKQKLRDMLVINGFHVRWSFEFSRAAVIFTILYSVRKQYPDFPEFRIIQELDNRVYPIVKDEFNPLILNAINNTQFDETIMTLVYLNDIVAFEHFLNEPTIKPYLHGDSVYQDMIEFIGENIEFKVVFTRAWSAENPADESESERFRL